MKKRTREPTLRKEISASEFEEHEPIALNEKGQLSVMTKYDSFSKLFETLARNSKFISLFYYIWYLILKWNKDNMWKYEYIFHILMSDKNLLILLLRLLANIFVTYYKKNYIIFNEGKKWDLRDAWRGYKCTLKKILIKV